MLKPITEGAGILYVVDGAMPYSIEYEPEMEILRWTGQPSIAVINPIGGDVHVHDWRRALEQYFRIVRVIDALTAPFEFSSIADNMSEPYALDGCQRREEAADNAGEIIDNVERLRKEEAAVKAAPRAGYKVWAADADITLEDFARPRNQEQEKRKKRKKRRRLNERAGIGVRIAVVIALIVATVALL